MTQQSHRSGLFRRTLQRVLEVSEVAVAIRYDAPWARAVRAARKTDTRDAGDDHAPELPAIMMHGAAARPC